MKELVIQEYRCICGKLLCRGAILNGAIEIKCLRCKNIKKVINKFDHRTRPNNYTFLLRRDCSIAQSSQSACDILGYQASEFEKKRITDIDPSLNCALIAKLWHSLEFSRSSSYTIHTTHYAKNQSAINVRMRLRYTIIEEREYLFISSLPQSSSCVPNAVNGTWFFISEISPDGCFIYVDDGVYRVLGYTPVELLSTSIFDYIFSKERGAHVRSFESSNNNATPFHLPACTFVTKSDGPKLCDVSFIPRFDDDGAFIGYIVLSLYALSKTDPILSMQPSTR